MKTETKNMHKLTANNKYNLLASYRSRYHYLRMNGQAQISSSVALHSLKMHFFHELGSYNCSILDYNYYCCLKNRISFRTLVWFLLLMKYVIKSG